jgi:hypothetical protein
VPRPVQSVALDHTRTRQVALAHLAFFRFFTDDMMRIGCDKQNCVWAACAALRQLIHRDVLTCIVSHPCSCLGLASEVLTANDWRMLVTVVVQYDAWSRVTLSEARQNRLLIQCVMP